MTPDLSLCVLAYNHPELLADCLASVDAQELPCSVEKLIVDNGSTPPLSLPSPHPYLSLPHPPWRLVRLPQNVGHIAGQNRCFEAANGRWVLFVANDVRLLKHFLPQLWQSRERHTISQPWLLTQEEGKTTEQRVDNCGLRWYWPGYGISNRDWLKTPEAFSGSCYLMPKRLWQIVGGFDEKLHSSHEDVEFSLRARRHYYRIKPSATAIAVHLGNATLRHQPSHNRAAFHHDRLYVINKHYCGLTRLLRLAAVYLLDSLPRP